MNQLNDGEPIGTPVAEEDIIIDSDDDFICLIEYEFSQTTDHIESRDVYDHYKPQAVINLKRMEALRKYYESALNRKPKSKYQTEPLIAADIEQLSADQHRATIRNFKSRFNIKCPVPRASTVADWTEARLYEHLKYWYVYHHHGRKEAMEAIQNMEIEDYRRWFDGL